MSGVAHATPAVVYPNGMEYVSGIIDVGAPEVTTTTSELYWIPQVVYWTGSEVAHYAYGNWHKKTNTGALTTVWPATYQTINTPHNYVWYAVYVHVWSNGDWYGYWAYDVQDGDYWTGWF